MFVFFIFFLLYRSFVLCRLSGGGGHVQAVQTAEDCSSASLRVNLIQVTVCVKTHSTAGNIRINRKGIERSLISQNCI